MMADERARETTVSRDGEETPTNQRSDSSSSDLKRREVIKLGAAALVAAVSAPEAIGRQASATSAGSVRAPLFFTAEEFKLVDELTDLIIPTDEHSPGARAARCAEYIDFRLSESLDEAPKRQWREGLKLVEQLSQEMHRKPFLESSPDQRIALLTRISQNEKNPQKPEEAFFRELKLRTARAYYTSEPGIKQEMEYKGNTYLKEFVGYDAT